MLCVHAVARQCNLAGIDRGRLEGFELVIRGQSSIEGQGQQLMGAGLQSRHMLQSAASSQPASPSAAHLREESCVL